MRKTTRCFTPIAILAVYVGNGQNWGNGHFVVTRFPSCRKNYLNCTLPMAPARAAKKTSAS